MLSEILHQVRDSWSITMAVMELMALGFVAQAFVPLGSFLAVMTSVMVWAEWLP